MKKWRKWIHLEDARLLSELFCNHFGLPYCEVYYIDRFHDGNTYGQYFSCGPHILMLHNRLLLNPIGILIHELTHHLEYAGYGNDGSIESSHGYYYQLAKKRVATWAKKHISSKPNWLEPLKALQTEIAMRKFRV